MAEATLATAAFVRAGFKVAATYTFAAPRSGDLKFKESIQTPFFRIEYGNDIVPHLPPVAIRQGLITLLDNPFLDHFSVLRDQLKELQDQLNAEILQVQAATDPQTEELTDIVIRPKKTNISVRLVGLAWKA